MSRKTSAVFRVGVSFESSILCMGEPVAREELGKIENGNAWKYYPRARHWDICHVDKKTGELFTVRDMENGEV